MIRFLIRLYVYIVIIDAVLSFFPSVRHYGWAKYIRKAAEFSLRPIRKVLPKDLPFDFSPLVVIFLLNLLMLLW